MIKGFTDTGYKGNVNARETKLWKKMMKKEIYALHDFKARVREVDNKVV